MFKMRFFLKDTIPNNLWRRTWQPTPVSLPGESHGQRSLVGYSPRGCKELDTTERLHYYTATTMVAFSHIHIHIDRHADLADSSAMGERLRSQAQEL